MMDSASQTDRPTPRGQRPSGIFVGRKPQLGELTAALEDALTGQGCMVMLAGEPGIGKTRTAQELAMLAEQRGAQVLWGRCYEEEGTPPYWPWVQLLRAYVQQADAEQLIAEMGPGAADIAEIVAEIGVKIPDLIPPPALEPEVARFRLFDSITTFLKNLARNQLLMLVLDDLHWADRSSLLLLEFVAREIGTSRFLLVGTYRDVEVSRRHPLSQTLGALVREQLFHRVQLDGLTQQEVGEMVEGSEGITLPPEAAEVIHTRTDGNPFFVAEVTRQVTLEDITEDPGWTSTIPEGVRDAIGRRLNRLSEQCNQILTTASVVGREFEFRLLSSIMGDTTEDQLLAAIDEAVGSHLIEELPRSVGRYQFTHALIQETLAEELSTTRVVRLHARIAEALEALFGDDLVAHAAELVYHFAESETVLGTEKMVRYSLIEGEKNLNTYAYDEALTYFQRSLVAKEGQPMGTEKAALLYGLGRAQTAKGQWQDAWGSVNQAFEYYHSVRDISMMLNIAKYPWELNPGTTDMAELIKRTLDELPSCSQDYGNLLSHLGVALNNEKGKYESAQDIFAQAIEIARRDNDVDLEMQTEVYAAEADRWQLNIQESLDRSLNAIELSSHIQNTWFEARAHRWAAIAQCIMGDSEKSLHHANRGLDLADKLRDPYSRGLSLWNIETLHRLKGEWEDSRQRNVEGLELIKADPSLLSSRVLLEYELDNFDKGDKFLEQLLRVGHGNNPGGSPGYVLPAWVKLSVARISGETKSIEDARRTLLTTLEMQSSSPIATTFARASLALLGILQNDIQACEEQYEELNITKIRGKAFYGGIGMIPDRLLGLLCLSRSRLVDASSHFKDALEFCRMSGYRPELAWTCVDYAETLQYKNTSRDRREAKLLLKQASTIADELRMFPLLRRIQSLVSPAISVAVDRDPLTPRQVEVLLLVAAGYSDQKIADELILARYTVSNHVKNIRDRIGGENRTEAVAIARELGLLTVQ